VLLRRRGNLSQVDARLAARSSLRKRDAFSACIDHTVSFGAHSVNASFLCQSGTLANTRFAYVRSFEQADALLPHCWIVIRVDGKGFTKCVKSPTLGARSPTHNIGSLTSLQRQVHRRTRVRQARRREGYTPHECCSAGAAPSSCLRFDSETHGWCAFCRLCWKSSLTLFSPTDIATSSVSCLGNIQSCMKDARGATQSWLQQRCALQ
jgi:tRNAHis guanylyltransferase